MLTQFGVTTASSSGLIFPLQDISQGYSIKDIEGLDPVKASITSSSYATIDGERYHHSRREARNIVIKLGLESNFVSNTISGLRKQLYNVFMPKTEVSLRFWDTEVVGGIVDIVGRVESFSAPLFTKEPEATISIMCGDPDFISPNKTIITQNTNGTGNALGDPEPFIYEGTVSTGILLTFKANKVFPNLSIKHLPPGNSWRSMDFSGELKLNDTLRIQTIPGSKYVRVQPSGKPNVSQLDDFSPYSDWFQLENGSNTINITTLLNSSPYTIEYYNRYGGL